ncbi:MAG: hypothetical protein AAFQ02_06880 [Bacteroidota bacterium]
MNETSPLNKTRTTGRLILVGMGFINFGNRIKHRKFDYIPRYYDPEKEDLDRRVKAYTSDNARNTRLAQDRIKAGFRKKYRAGEDSYASSAKRKSNRILILVMMGLLVVTYIFLVEYLPAIAEKFGD